MAALFFAQPCGEPMQVRLKCIVRILHFDTTLFLSIFVDDKAILWQMRITISIEYFTASYELLQLRMVDDTVVEMRAVSDSRWVADMNVAADTATIDYCVEVVASNRVVRKEWGDGRRIPLDTTAERVVVADAWRDMPDCNAFYCLMFTDVIFAHAVTPCAPLSAGSIYIEVEAPTLRSGESLAVAGASERFGEWNVSAMVPMRYVGGVRWGVAIENAALRSDTEYKFVVVDASGNVVRWEQGANRRLHLPESTADAACMVVGLRLRDDAVWRGAGVAVPVFSLRSEQSGGVGEFADLRLLADWCAHCGEHVIQILPINDTTMTGSWRDSYPYNANSTFALHPLYVRLSEIGRLRDKTAQARLDGMCAELNALPQVDYERVMQVKTEGLRLLYQECGAECLASDEYAAFAAANASWLESYAVYSVLRDRFRTADFGQWGRYAQFDAAECARFATDNREDVGFYCFVQFHLDRQLRSVRDYLHSKGIVLKGDIPIGISRTSVDAWTSPRLFVMDSSAGAPPDDFAVTGQNWGFPIYDWSEMAKDDYGWWRARFGKMAEYFDAYRIDHILGFFRIWEIPLDAVNALLGEFNPSLPYTEAEIRGAGFDFDAARDVARDHTSDNVLWLEYRHKKGCYYPRIAPFATQRFAELPEGQKQAFARLHDDFYYHRHNAFWREIAEKRLAMLIAATSMLPCGEDLGMIPQCVPEVMRRLQILSLEIERMPKSSERVFADTVHYPYLSVCTTSTHDMNPLRAWWRENREQTQLYYNTVMGCEGDAPVDASPTICRNIVERHLRSSSMLTILPLQDWLSIDGALRAADAEAERINIPADADHYWRYRMHLTLESLLEADDFNRAVASMIARCGR